MKKNTLILISTTVVGNVIRLLSTIIITRILAPDAFALVGFVGSLLFVLNMISDSGFRGYIMKHENGNDEHFLNCLWTIKLVRGLGLFILMLALSNPIASIITIEGLAHGIQITSVLFLIQCASSLYPFVEERLNRPSVPLIIEAVSGVIASLITIISTIIIESKWCLVLGLIYGPVLQTIFSYIFIKQPMPKLRVDRSHFIEFWHWSKFIIPSSIITMLITQVDKFALGKVLTPESLGMFYIATNLAGIFDAFTISYSRKIVMPALAAAKHATGTTPAGSQYIYKNFTITMLSICLGVVCGLSEFIVDVIYTPEYQGVAIFLSILMLKPMLSALAYPNEALLVILGNVRATLIGNIARLIGIVVCFVPLYYLFDEYGIVFVFTSSSVFAIGYFFYYARNDHIIQIKRELTYIAIFIIFAAIGKWLSPHFSEVFHYFVQPL